MGRSVGRGAWSGPVLLAVATALLVVADGVGGLTAHHVAGRQGCSSTTQTSAVAPILLAGGGFLVVLSLAVRLATVGAAAGAGGALGRGAPRPRRGLFLTLWIFVLLAYALSGLVMYTVSSFKLCL